MVYLGLEPWAPGRIHWAMVAPLVVFKQGYRGKLNLILPLFVVIYDYKSSVTWTTVIYTLINLFEVKNVQQATIGHDKTSSKKIAYYCHKFQYNDYFLFQFKQICQTFLILWNIMGSNSFKY